MIRKDIIVFAALAAVSNTVPLQRDQLGFGFEGHYLS